VRLTTLFNLRVVIQPIACWCMLFIGLAFVSGCASDSFVDRGILSAQSVGENIEGPYQFKMALSSTEILLLDSGGEIRVRLRGVRNTGDKEVDEASAKNLNQWLRIQDVYLLKTSIAAVPDGAREAVVLKPTTEFADIDASTGEIKHHIKNYAIVQSWLLELGEVVLNREDEAYDLCASFAKSEEIAKKNRSGYWGKLAK